MPPSLPARSHPPRRRLAAGLAALLGLALVAATPGLASAAPTRNRADAAAGWLGRQLEDNAVATSFGPSYGATADVVLALSAAGVGKGTAAGATKVLRRNVLGYTGGGDAAEYYAGSFAKLLVVAAARHVDPRSFGGSARSDLVAELRGLECGPRRPGCPAGDRGRFSDISQYGDFSNTITQSLALVGLQRTTAAGPSPSAVRYLLGQQCPGGGFPEVFGGDTCRGSVDATGFAVQALVATGGPAASQAAAHAGRWLARKQHANGSFTGNAVRNANSTALAAQAFIALDRGRKAAKARHFVRSLQAGCGARKAARGSVRYSRADAGDRVLATSQAVPALARVTLAEVSKDGIARGLPRLSC